MGEELVQSVLELSLHFKESCPIGLEDLRECLIFAFLFDELGDQVGEVDGSADVLFDLLDLLLIEDVVQTIYLGGSVIAIKLDSWESEFTLFHVVVDLLVEVLAHVCLKDDWEMIAVPVAIAARLQ